MKFLFCFILFFSCVYCGGSDEDTTLVRCYTTAGADPVDIELHKSWSPLGVARFLELVNDGYFDRSPLFRVVPNFLVQFGISLDQEKENYWMNKKFPDEDPHTHHNFERGTVSFAGNGKDSRTTQLFISYGNNPHLGKAMHETPIGKVVSGMEVVDNFFNGNGEYSMDMEPWGKGPDQHKIRAGGKQYLQDNYPEISYFKECKQLSETERKREEIKKKWKGEKKEREENEKEKERGEEGWAEKIKRKRREEDRFEEKMKRKDAREEKKKRKLEEKRARREDGVESPYRLRRQEIEERIQQKMSDLGMLPGSEEYKKKERELRKEIRKEMKKKMEL